LGVSRKDSFLMSLPDDVFEWIGKAVRQSVELETLRIRNEYVAERDLRNKEFEALKIDIKESIETIIRGINVLKAGIKDGKDGLDGKDGKDGLDGKEGQKGETGAPGEKGEKGDPGQAGPQGERGEAGAPGEAGERGEKGDPGTNGKDGADGVITTKVAAYRGVWADGEVYTLGDFVTWGGSLWHSNSAEVKSKPGDGEDWTLAVKRGRDGKDGKNGDPGPIGKSGPKGDKGDRGFDA
jgi:hypothetical protein